MNFRPKIVEGRSIYKPRFKGYYYVRSIIQIIDGLVGLCVTPFKKESILYSEFCEWNLREDYNRRRKNDRIKVKRPCTR